MRERQRKKERESERKKKKKGKIYIRKLLIKDVDDDLPKYPK